MRDLTVQQQPKTAIETIDMNRVRELMTRWQRDL
jgi:hypothetical protein